MNTLLSEDEFAIWMSPPEEQVFADLELVLDTLTHRSITATEYVIFEYCAERLANHYTNPLPKGLRRWAEDIVQRIP